MDTKFQSDLNHFLKLREQITSMETKTYHTVLAVKGYLFKMPNTFATNRSNKLSYVA